MECIGGNVLAFVLSYTELSDKLSCMLVCKAWYAASRNPHFWEHNKCSRIFEMLHKHQRKLEISLSDIETLVKKFDPFKDFPGFDDRIPKQTLRNSVEWMFLKHGCRVVHYLPLVKEEKMIDIYYMYDSNAESWKGFAFRKSTWDITYLIYVNLVSSWSTVTDSSGLYIQFSMVTSVDLKKLEIDNISHGLRKGIRRCNEFAATYEGELMFNSKMNVPHGNGKWTFDDGTIIEGKGVAYEGSPMVPWSMWKQ